MSDLLKKTSDSLIHSFLVSNLSNSLSSLIFGERPERFAHSHSFDISDRSDSLTVAHLSWAIWANHSQWLIWFKQKEQMSDERMSKFPALEKQAIGSFLVSDLSHLLTVALLSWVTWAIHSHRSLKKEGMSESLRIFKLTKKCTKNMIVFNFF